ncbi:MAG TPA: DUF2238 domain-containing protein [Streptosporangiaceae bacterium]|nr:DUF2238 domain-containing protein [Streptosporangiaceae bacterium]
MTEILMTRNDARSVTTDRAPLSRAERIAIGMGAAAMVGFGTYGIATGSPSTFGYLFTVVVIGAAIAWLRRDALPDLLAIGLAMAATVHLAGGFINVEHNVLYNGYLGPYDKALGTHLLQYDHFAHAFASFVIVFAAWFLLAKPNLAGKGRRELLILAVGTALGMGGLNEMIEFLATIAHHGAHVGGYLNTGWDLICNFIGASTAGIILARSRA